MRCRPILAAAALALAAAGCGSAADQTTDEPRDQEPASTTDPAPVDEERTRDDIDCSPEALDDEEFEFRVAHYVVDGTLGAACLGDADETLLRAWEELAAITPPDQLNDLGLFGGFDALDDSDEITLAYVNTLDDGGDVFQMSVNLDAYEDDADEAKLTMAHEFSHVFTSLPSQIDRTELDADACATYFNGEGCFTSDSLMWEWISQFWGDGLIDEIDPDVEPTAADGQGRCDAEPGFFGAYAASSPEEDFAETFSAFVYRVPADTDAQQDKLDWMADQPGLAEFQARAVDAGLGPLDNAFDPCG